MNRVDEYISYHHPRWKWKLFKKAVAGAQSLGQQWKMLKAVTTTGTKLNTFVPEMPAVPPTPRKTPAKKRIVKKKQTIEKKRAANKKFVATHSTGYVGAFKKAKKQKRKGASRFDTSGVVYKSEYSGVQTGNETVYVGHGTPLEEVIKGAFRALVRSHWKKGGLDVSDWNDKAQFVGQWYVYYTYGTATTTQGTFILIGVDDTYSIIAGNMVSALRATITDSNILNSMNFITSRIYIDVKNGEGAPSYVNFSEINLKNYKITTDYWSILKVKNVTLAGADSANADRDLSTNIESQPLVGRSYATKKWGNGFQLYKQLDSGGVPQVHANVNTGVLATEGNIIGFPGSGSFNPFLKPPPAYMLGTDKTQKVRINPGELKVDVVKFKCELYFVSLMNKLIFALNTSSDQQMREFGACHMYAFEREVEIGPRNALSVRIAYQVDFVLKMCGRSVANKVAPFVDCAQPGDPVLTG